LEELILNALQLTPLEQAQKVMLDMLITLHKICKEHDIKFWITDGTLLGSVRHKGFIPWDDDADLAMLREDYEKFLRIIPNHLPKPYKLETEKVNTHGKHNWTKILYLDDFEWQESDGTHRKGISIDIFPFDYVSESATPLEKIVRKLAAINYPSKINGPADVARRILNKSKFFKLYVKGLKKTNAVTYGMETGYYRWHNFELSEIFPLKEGIFDGHMFPVPNDADRYLSGMYGNYMQIPEESKQQAHMQNLKVTKQHV